MKKKTCESCEQTATVPPWSEHCMEKLDESLARVFCTDALSSGPVIDIEEVKK